jgi:outer membrane protein assembly factor BamE (lipoprotein component of BamABCDE complex)
MSVFSSIALVTALCTGLTSCQTTSTAPAASIASPSAVGDISNEQAEQPPFVGMTKAQALARYGEPKKHTITAKGEQWIYILNFGEVLGKAFIPFNFKPTMMRTGTLTFGPNGKVTEFTWDVPTEG